MRGIWQGVWLVLLYALALAAQAAAPDARGRTMVPGSRVSFVAPDGFTALSDAEIAIKFPNAAPPANGVGNAKRTTTIVFEFKQIPLSPEAMGKMAQALQDGMEWGVPGLRWVRRDSVSLGGQDWIWMEATSRAIDTDIHNIVLLTSHQGRALMMNFNATREDFVKLEPALRESIHSIRID